jgi:hypothetical protein
MVGATQCKEGGGAAAYLTLSFSTPIPLYNSIRQCDLSGDKKARRSGDVPEDPGVFF